MRITVVGTGYVGLTTAVCLAAKGHKVFCFDVDRKRIKQVSRGVPFIYEDGLEGLLQEVLAKEALIPTLNLGKSIQNSDVTFICVGTPCGDDGSINLAQIRNAAEGIGLVLRNTSSYHVVVVKSTVVPGTTETVVIPLLELCSGKNAGKDFGVCMNPEFLKEGHAVEDFMFPKDAGIIVGEFDKSSGDLVAKVYKDFESELLRTSVRAAEMIKYARNCYLAKDISFSNEIANICQRMGVDYLDVKKGLELDSRIGKGRFLDAGAGFGGSCFPKDVSALVAEAKKVGIKPLILESTLQVNEIQPNVLIRLAKDVVGNSLEGRNVTVLGLAFKPGTDDIREAPSIKLIKALIYEGCKIRVFDSKALENTRRLFGNLIEYAASAEASLQSADICIIITEWPKFANPKIYSHMKNRVIIDGRRVLNPDMLPSGFTYHAIGLPRAVKT